MTDSCKYYISKKNILTNRKQLNIFINNILQETK